MPVIQGVIDRRVLVNYRVDPQRVAACLPRPFRPRLVEGWAVAGICLIRLRALRPRLMPLPCGLRSENAAHRIAVEWEQDGEVKHGVYIPRRDTNSWLNTLAGGRLFPGEHHHARFEVDESDEHLSIEIRSDDEQTHIHVSAHLADALPLGSIFNSLESASDFFESGSLGYSATSNPDRFDGMELLCHQWHISPLAVDQVASSFFDDPTRFPPGTAQFDCALLMRGIAHQWHSRADLCCAPVDAQNATARAS